MTLPDIDAVASFGGLLNDYAPVTDPTTDRPSGGATLPTTGSNIAYVDIAMMSAMCPRARATFTAAASTGALVLVSHQSMWGSLVAVAPTLVRTGTGVFTVTWPVMVQDQALVSHTLSFKSGCVNNASGGVAIGGVAYAANVGTVTVLSGGVASDAVGQTFDVFAFY